LRWVVTWSLHIVSQLQEIAKLQIVTPLLLKLNTKGIGVIIVVALVVVLVVVAVLVNCRLHIFNDNVVVLLVTNRRPEKCVTGFVQFQKGLNRGNLKTNI
jgi:hypothetical protein